jgi:hypothetical protein
MTALLDVAPRRHAELFGEEPREVRLIRKLQLGGHVAWRLARKQQLGRKRDAPLPVNSSRRVAHDLVKQTVQVKRATADLAGQLDRAHRTCVPKQDLDSLTNYARTTIGQGNGRQDLGAEGLHAPERALHTIPHFQRDRPPTSAGLAADFTTFVQVGAGSGSPVRWQVIHGELNIAVRGPRATRDVNQADCLPTTEHLLVYADELCVGTGRLMFPNPEVAQLCGTRIGFELESSFDLEQLLPIQDQLVEVSRVAVMKDWYNSGAAACLFEGIAAISWLQGKRYLLGEVDCQTGILAEAQLMQAKLERLGVMHPSYRVRAGWREPAHDETRDPPTGSGFYSAAQRDAGQRGQLAELPLPRALGVFIKRLGARCIADEPALHPTFPRYVLPMLASLDALPVATVKTFDRSVVASTLGTLRTHHTASKRHQSGRIAS